MRKVEHAEVRYVPEAQLESAELGVGLRQSGERGHIPKLRSFLRNSAQEGTEARWQVRCKVDICK